MLKKIAIKDLQPGMVIVKVTEQNGPVTIKKAGLVTSQDMLQGLMEMGILQVEIDTEQTVEVSTKKIKKSPTQKMLENSTVPPMRKDNAMSEQFHRSLFMTSVENIASPWLFYTKRYLLAGLMVLGGLGLGWTLANYSLIVELLAANQPKVAASVTKTPQIDTDKVDTIKGENKGNTQLPQQPTSKAPLEPSSELVSDPVAQLATNPSAINQIVPIADVPKVTASQEPAPNISPELLRRFENAISEVEVAPQKTPPQPATAEQAVPRIDQLPAWVMTRLPSMAFSAHMYASQPSERWVRVNGSRMVEGDKIDGMIEIIRIEPQHVILNYSGQTFSMAALTDW